MKKWLSKIDYLIVSAATIIGSLMSFIYSVYAKKYISPYDYGVFSTCLLLQTYLNYAQLGTLNSYNRDYPQLIGGDQKKDAEILKQSTFTFLIVIYSVAALLTFFVVFLSCGVKVFSDYRSMGYVACAIAALFENLSNFCIYTERMEGRNNKTAVVWMLKTVIGILLGLIGIRLWGYYGLYIVPVIGPLVIIICYSNRVKNLLRFRIEWNILANSIKTGIPLLINSFVWTLMSSVDKFVILFFMTTEDLGVYSVPLLGFSTLVMIPSTISQIFYYRVSEYYGKTNDITGMIEQCNKCTRVIGWLTGLVAVISFYALPIFVDYFMPQYSDGIRPAQILIIGVAFYSATMLYGNIFSVLKHNKTLIVNSIVLCIFNIIFSVLFVFINGKVIDNVAVGTSFSYFLYALVLFSKIHKEFGYGYKNLFINGLLPVLIAILPCIAFSNLISSSYLAMFATLFVFAIGSIPLYLLTKKG